MRKTSSRNDIRNRYNRIAFLFDFIEIPLELLRFGRWRGKLPGSVQGEQVLEIGVGTGKNMTYYPTGVEIMAIDFSPRMLKRARKKATKKGVNVTLLEMDVQQLAFPDHFFDTVFATFVFCSVPDPVAGLRELRRVCKPQGRLLLLEHMRPENPLAGLVFDLFNPLVVRTMGANINRRTIDNIEAAGWKIQVVEKLSSDIVRWIEAEP